ncbi:band 4.1-like protein 4A isoform X2 [Sycon ciliatum]|uniref:band 4.1-like protein 4A isoform X2 n=1 Tax=Sycon ciliatum TaxID=27933 RepID=UPI0031F5FFBB
MGRRSPNVMPGRRRSNVQLCIRVLLLDDQYQTFFIDSKCTGLDFFALVCNELDLLERDFFALRFQDTNQQLFWMDPVETVKKQLKSSPEADCYLCVKYYVADPCSLREELTRYFFFLQVKRDIFQGRIMATRSMAPTLFACLLQSELGDYSSDDLHPDYVHEFEFVAGQSLDLEAEAEQVHRTLSGLVPSDAEKKFLDKAKWLPLYGVDLHPVKGAVGTALQIGISQVGIAVFQNATRVSFFHWPKINKVQFKRKFFILQVVETKVNQLKYKFLTSSERSAKELWKCAVEQHCFFRRIVIDPNDDFSRGGGLLRSGSKFRYTGRTEFQVRQSLRAVNREQPHFTRIDSRHFRRSLPPALHLPTVGHHWRSHRGLTINDNPHSKALKLSRKQSSAENHHHESLFLRLSRPLRRSTGPETPNASTNRKASNKSKSESTGLGQSGGHARVQKTVSTPSFWLRKVRRARTPDECPLSQSLGPLYASPVKTPTKGGSMKSTGEHSNNDWGTPMTTRSTESTQRFTMPWCDEPEPLQASPPAPPQAGQESNSRQTSPKISDLYCTQRNELMKRQQRQQAKAPQQSQGHTRAKSLGSGMTAAQDFTDDYAVPRPQPAAPPPPSSSLNATGHTSPAHHYQQQQHKKLARSPIAGGQRQCLEVLQPLPPRPKSAEGAHSNTNHGSGRTRLFSSGSGVPGGGEWPWRNSATPTPGDPASAADSPGLEPDYLLEESVSDEAHKRYMKKLWDDMAYADSPPPIDLNVKPRVVTRRTSGSAIKARRLGARSAVLTGTEADKVARTVGISSRYSSGDPEGTAAGGGGEAFPGLSRQAASSSGLFQPGCSDTLPAIPKRNSGAGDKRRGISARDRRASVLGVQLFAKSPPRQQSSDGEVKKAVFSASSVEDGEGHVTDSPRHLQHNQHHTERQQQEDHTRNASTGTDGVETDGNDVVESSGTFEMRSPLQHRITDVDIAQVRLRKHAALTKKRSLPLYLHRKEPGDDDDEDDDDEEEEDDGNESDFGYLPGDEPLGNSGNSGSGDVVMSRNNRHSGKRNNKGDLHKTGGGAPHPVIAQLKDMDYKVVNGRIASFGSAISDDVFAETSPNATSGKGTVGCSEFTEICPGVGSDQQQVPAEDRWFESP